MSQRKPWVLGVTGASGTAYAASVLRGLLTAGEAVDVVISRAARLTLLDEQGISFRDKRWREDLERWCGTTGGDLRYWAPADFAAGPSSGTYPTKGMVVVPATSASVAGIALGLSKDLIQRAGEVTLKERRPLVVVPRETPVTRSMLQRMLELTDEGAVVLPANPGFYGGAGTVAELVDFVAGRVLDQLGVPHDLYRRWDGQLRGQTADEAD